MPDWPVMIFVMPVLIVTRLNAIHWSKSPPIRRAAVHAIAPALETTIVDCPDPMAATASSRARSTREVNCL